ncbi:hypothetical protein D3C80_1542810 [compost metagenome]
MFKTEPGAESLPINLGREGYVWFDVEQITPDRDRTLSEVRDEVAADWTAEQQKTALAAKADELKARLEKGETLAALADELGIVVENKMGLKRNSEDAVLGMQAVTAAFSGTVGAIASTPGADGASRILLQVTDVDSDALPDALSNDDQQLTAMAQAAGDDILDQMVNRLQSDYGVTINQAAADQAMVGF